MIDKIQSAVMSEFDYMMWTRARERLKEFKIPKKTSKYVRDMLLFSLYTEERTNATVECMTALNKALKEYADKVTSLENQNI